MASETIANHTEEIDIVILWVDGNDPEWQKEFIRYKGIESLEQSNSAIRYRDYGLLPYWFRGVETFAPWIRKIHFVTCGQKPSWLNLSHPKLHFVEHKDIIPARYLPTFNSCCIEMFINRIEGLAEKFIYFNDDLFFINRVTPEDFFHNGLPRDCALEFPVQGENSANTILWLNRHFSKRQVQKSHFSKWFSLHYRKKLLFNLLLAPFPTVAGFTVPHLPQPFLKKTLDTVWEVSPEELEKSARSRFRNGNEHSQWIFRFWQLMSGDFYPTYPYKQKKYFLLQEDNEELYRCISRQEQKVICINDKEDIPFDTIKKRLESSFANILPDKSTFEL